MTRQAVVVCPADRGDPNRLVGGISLLERQLRQLSEAGFESVCVVHAPHRALPAPSPRVTAQVRFVPSEAEGAWPMAAAVADSVDDRAVLVAGDLLVDSRLWKWLAERTDDVLVSVTGGSPEVLGCLSRAALPACASGGAAGPRVVALAEFPTYSKSHRGDVPYHLLPVRTEADVETGWRVLLDYVEKRTKDLPATYFDPWFENPLVRFFAGTPVTPNQITLATTVLGFFVAWLFSVGVLRLGILLAIVVEVLDGVDGKLARIKHQTSKVGELEHVMDTLYELSWYLGLGSYLASAGSAWAWPVSLLLCGVDVADNLAYLCFSRRGGGNLDEASPMLARFRLVAGRRNIYAWICLPAIFAGAAPAGFAAAFGWAAVTAAVHWSQALGLPVPATPNAAASAAPRTPEGPAQSPPPG